MTMTPFTEHNIRASVRAALREATPPLSFQRDAGNLDDMNQPTLAAGYREIAWRIRSHSANGHAWDGRICQTCGDVR